MKMPRSQCLGQGTSSISPTSRNPACLIMIELPKVYHCTPTVMREIRIVSDTTTSAVLPNSTLLNMRPTLQSCSKSRVCISVLLATFEFFHPTHYRV